MLSLATISDSPAVGDAAGHRAVSPIGRTTQLSAPPSARRDDISLAPHRSPSSDDPDGPSRPGETCDSTSVSTEISRPYGFRNSSSEKLSWQGYQVEATDITRKLARRKVLRHHLSPSKAQGYDVSARAAEAWMAASVGSVCAEGRACDQCVWRHREQPDTAPECIVVTDCPEMGGSCSLCWSKKEVCRPAASTPSAPSVTPPTSTARMAAAPKRSLDATHTDVHADLQPPTKRARSGATQFQPDMRMPATVGDTPLPMDTTIRNAAAAPKVTTISRVHPVETFLTWAWNPLDILEGMREDSKRRIYELAEAKGLMWSVKGCQDLKHTSPIMMAAQSQRSEPSRPRFPPIFRDASRPGLGASKAKSAQVERDWRAYFAMSSDKLMAKIEATERDLYEESVRHAILDGVIKIWS